jgi:hypothetical protein
MRPHATGSRHTEGRQRLSRAGVDVAVRRSLPDVGGQHLRRTYIIAQHFDAKNDLQVPLLPTARECAQHRFQQVAARQKLSHSEGPEMIQSGSDEERVAGFGVKQPGHDRAVFVTARFPGAWLPADKFARAPVANPVHRSLGFEDEARVLRQVQRPPVGESTCAASLAFAQNVSSSPEPLDTLTVRAWSRRYSSISLPTIAHQKWDTSVSD